MHVCSVCHVTPQPAAQPLCVHSTVRVTHWFACRRRWPRRALPRVPCDFHGPPLPTKSATTVLAHSHAPLTFQTPLCQQTQAQLAEAAAAALASPRNAARSMGLSGLASPPPAPVPPSPLPPLLPAAVPANGAAAGGLSPAQVSVNAERLLAAYVCSKA